MQGAGYIAELIRAAKSGRPIVLLPPEEALRLASGNLRWDCNVELAVRRAGDDPEYGELLDVRRSHNLVVANGRQVVRDLLLNIGPAPGFIAVGTGATAPTDADLALGNEVYRDLITRRNSGTALARFKLFVPDTAANGYTISEAGLFVSAQYPNGSIPLGGGALFARTVFAPITKDNTVQFTITWDVLLSS